MSVHQNVKVFWPYNPHNGSHNIDLTTEEKEHFKKNKKNLYEIPLKEYKFEYNEKPTQKWNNSVDTHSELPGPKITEVKLDDMYSGITKNSDGSFSYKGHGSNRGYIIELPENISKNIKNVTSWRIDVKMKLDVKYDKETNKEYISFNKTFANTNKSPFAIAGCSRLSWSHSNNNNFLPEIVDAPFYLQLNSNNSSTEEEVIGDYKNIKWNYTDNRDNRTFISPAPIESANKSSFDKNSWRDFSNNDFSIWNSDTLNNSNVIIDLEKSISKPLSYKTNINTIPYFWTTQISSNMRISENVNTPQSSVPFTYNNSYFGSKSDVDTKVVNEFLIFNDTYVSMNPLSRKSKNKYNIDIWNNGLKNFNLNKNSKVDESILYNENYVGVIPTYQDKTRHEYTENNPGKYPNESFLGAWYKDNNVKPFSDKKIKIHFFTGHSVLERYIVDDIIITINSPLDAAKQEFTTPLPQTLLDDQIAMRKRDIVYDLILNSNGYKPFLKGMQFNFSDFNFLSNASPNNTSTSIVLPSSLLGIPGSNKISPNYSNLPLGKYIIKYGTRHETKIFYDIFSLIKNIWKRATNVDKYSKLLTEGSPNLISMSEANLLPDEKEIKNAHKNIDKEFKTLNNLITNFNKQVKETILNKSNTLSGTTLNTEFDKAEEYSRNILFQIPLFVKNVIRDYIRVRNNTFKPTQKRLHLQYSQPYFHIHVNKDKTGEYVVRKNITNVRGGVICPDFLLQQYNSNNYSRNNASWGYGYNTLNSFNDNKSLFLILPKNITKYDNFVASSNYVPKIIRYRLEMDVSILGFNRSLNKNSVSWDTQTLNANQRVRNNILFSFGQQRTLSMVRNTEITTIGKRNNLKLNLLNLSEYNTNYERNDGLDLNVINVIDKNNSDINFNTTNTSKNYFRIKYDIIHRNTNNATNDHNSNVIVIIKPLDENNNELDQSEVYYSENTWNDANTNSNKMNIGNNSTNWINKTDSSQVEPKTFSSVPNVKDNTKGTLPEFTFDDRSKHYLLNTQRLGALKVSVNDEKHIAIRLFSDNQNSIHRDTPWNYTYSNVKLFMDIPEENIIQIMKDNFDDTILNLDNTDDIKIQINDVNLTKLNNGLTETNDFTPNIDANIRTQLTNKKNIVSAYLDLKTKISESESEGNTNGYKKLDEVRNNYNNFISKGNVLNFDYTNLSISNKAKTLIELYEYENDLNNDIYKSDGTLNNDLPLNTVVSYTTKYRYENDFNNNDLNKWKKGHYSDFKITRLDAITLRNLIQSNNEKKFKDDYSKISKKDIVSLSKLYVDASNNNLYKYANDDIKIIMDDLKEFVINTRLSYIEEIVKMGQEIDTNNYTGSVSTIIDLIYKGYKQGYDGISEVKVEMDSLLKKGERYRIKMENLKMREIDINISSFDFKKKIDEVNNLGLNKVIKDGSITIDNNTTFMKQLKYIFNNLIKIEYINTYDLLDTNWKKNNDFEYRVNNKSKTYEKHISQADLSYNADITPIGTQDELTFIRTLISNDIWIGAQQKGSSNSDGTSANWKWNDGTDWNYTNWSSGQPDSKLEKYIKLKSNNEWEDISGTSPTDGSEILLPTVYKRDYKKPENKFVQLMKQYELLNSNSNDINMNESVFVDLYGNIVSRDYTTILNKLRGEINTEASSYLNKIIEILKNIGDENVNVSEIAGIMDSRELVENNYKKSDFGNDWIEIPYLLIDNQYKNILHNWKITLNGALQNFNDNLSNNNFGILIEKVSRANDVNYDFSNSMDIVKTIDFQVRNLNSSISNSNYSSIKNSNKLISELKEKRILDDNFNFINLDSNKYSEFKNNIDNLLKKRKNIIEEKEKELDVIIKKRSIDELTNILEVYKKEEYAEHNDILRKKIDYGNDYVNQLSVIFVDDLNSRANFSNSDNTVAIIANLQNSIDNAITGGIKRTNNSLSNAIDKYSSVLDYEITQLEQRVNNFNENLYSDYNNLKTVLFGTESISNKFGNDVNKNDVVINANNVYEKANNNINRLMNDGDDYIRQINELIIHRKYLNTKERLRTEINSFINSLNPAAGARVESSFISKMNLNRDQLTININLSNNFSQGDGLYYSINDQNDDKFIFINDSNNLNYSQSRDKRVASVSFNCNTGPITVNFVKTTRYDRIPGSIFLSKDNHIYVPKNPNNFQTLKNDDKPDMYMLINGLPDDINTITENTTLTLKVKCIEKKRFSNVNKHNTYSSTSVGFNYLMNKQAIFASKATSSKVPQSSGGSHSRLLKLKGIHA